MLKNNLKLNDTFLVTVEIITSDAIIVSANINSLIFRGTLIRCNKKSPCSFKKLPDNQSSFSASRLDLKNLKRQIRFKTFKSSYNLRRANDKIIKAKQNIHKSDSKDTKALSQYKPLSIKLKKDNGVYVNATNSLSDNDSVLSTINRVMPKPDLSAQTHTSNIIKIVKTKMKSNEYQYSIINNTNNADSNVDNPPPSKILKLCISPISNTILSRSACCDQNISSNQSFCSNICDDSPEKSNKSNLDKASIHTSLSIPLNDNIVKSEPNHSIINMSPFPTNSIDHNSPCITKLKIIKNGSKPNSYTIKSSDIRSNLAAKRYNCKQFSVGDIVWAKLSGYAIWPAKIIDLRHDIDYVTVMWLGDDYRTSKLARRKLWDFGAHFHEKFNKKAKGNYVTAVQQAQLEYSKLDVSEAGSAWFFDISSESSTLESVNIDEASCELDRMSSRDSSRQNIYLPLADEEFELMRPSSKSGMSDFLSFDSPDSHERDHPSSAMISHRTELSSHVSPFPTQFPLNTSDIVHYNFI